jgi:cytochrome c oxidase assembly protein Cox11
VVNDVDMSGVDTITLSYTFYPAATPAQANAAKPAATGAGPDQSKPL